MRQCGSQADVVGQNATTTAYREAGRWDCALSLLLATQEGLLEIGEIGCNTSISACESGGQWAWALRTLAQMKEVFGGAKRDHL